MRHWRNGYAPAMREAFDAIDETRAAMRAMQEGHRKLREARLTPNAEDELLRLLRALDGEADQLRELFRETDGLQAYVRGLLNRGFETTRPIKPI